MQSPINSQLPKRFWSQVQQGETPDVCWEWLALKYPQGYGLISIRDRNYRAHRLMYYDTYKVSIEKKLVMHLCNNPGCVNPKHLELGTAQDNTDYMMKCGRQKFGRVGSKPHRLLEPYRTHVISYLQQGVKAKDIAVYFGVSRSIIAYIRKQHREGLV